MKNFEGNLACDKSFNNQLCINKILNLMDFLLFFSDKIYYDLKSEILFSKKKTFLILKIILNK